MAAPRNRRHLSVPSPPAVERYRPHNSGGGQKKFIPPVERTVHGAALKRALDGAVLEAVQRRQESGIVIEGAQPGLYVDFHSQPNVRLDVASLENARQGIEVVAVTRSRKQDAPEELVESATVFVPMDGVNHFMDRFDAYSNPAPKKERERRYEAMLDPVAGLGLATLRSLWTDQLEAYPDEDQTVWWEVWLRRCDEKELERFHMFAAALAIAVAPRRLTFNDRVVLLAQATARQFASAVDVLSDVAELRLAKVTASSFVDMGPEEEGIWTKELRERILPSPANAPAVCILDTGVTRAHPLLDEWLSETDCHTCDPAWGLYDHDGHGTEMAGLALLGDLTPLLAGTQTISPTHRLESVKLLPPERFGPNPPELYGTITAEAVSRPEVQAPERRRVFSMSVAATDQRDRGQPTSWSAAIDALAAGRSFDVHKDGLEYLDDGENPVRRLFVLCAGNVPPESLAVEHLDRSDVEAIHDPGQAWNALTVGAFTEKAVLHDPAWAEFEPVARSGDLSPWSTTGVTFAEAWPIKPDVVFEGGNVVKDFEDVMHFPCPDVSVLSTHFRPNRKSFVLSGMTSAATAQAARLAAIIWADYPTYWPETVRALIVHSAEWTAQMSAHLLAAGGKRDRMKLVQRYGYGVPSAERALRSADDALTLVVQESIQPFVAGKLRELQLFELPWPRDVLADLGAARVRLRVTLSYFVEPNAPRRGWKKKHQYASHGLRFDVKSPTESLDEFRKRLNENALAEGESKPSGKGLLSEWFLGDQARTRGSLHSDLLFCTAADLAERGVLAVYPVGGWWKDQPKHDRSQRGVRYSLIVSIETPGVETDIWSPVAAQVGVLVDVATVI